MEVSTNSDVHNYNTRTSDMLRLPHATDIWVKQRVRYHSLNDWNNLDNDIRNRTAYRFLYFCIFRVQILRPLRKVWVELVLRGFSPVAPVFLSRQKPAFDLS